jgi:hypothetical protein
VLAVALAGCGGDSKDGAGPLRTDSTDLPHDAAPTTGNAKKFIHRWAAAEARMENTGRTAQYLTLSKQCPSCRDLAAAVRQYYAAGGYIRGGAWRIDSIEADPSSQAVGIYTVHARSAPTTVKPSSSRAEEHLPGRRVTYLLGLLSTSGSYEVTSRTLGG